MARSGLPTRHHRPSGEGCRRTGLQRARHPQAPDRSSPRGSETGAWPAFHACRCAACHKHASSPLNSRMAVSPGTGMPRMANVAGRSSSARSSRAARKMPRHSPTSPPSPGGRCADARTQRHDVPGASRCPLPRCESLSTHTSRRPATTWQLPGPRLGISGCQTPDGEPAHPRPGPGLGRGAFELAKWMPGQPSRAGCAP